jgi:hypothetical protein
VTNGTPYLGLNPTTIPVSNSELNTFRDCRRKWWLSYYRGLRKKEYSLVGPLPLGTRVHNALEAYYGYGADLMQSYRNLLAADVQLFAATRDAADPERVKKFNNEAELGRIMLEGYLEWLEESNADADIEVVGAEMILAKRLESFDSRIELQGKLDLKVRQKFDNARLSFDHKTAAGFDGYFKTGHMSEQLMMYTMLEKMQGHTDEAPIDGGIYNLLKKVKRSATAKPPFYTRLTVRFNSSTIGAFWVRTTGTLRDMMFVRKALEDGVDHRYVAYPYPKDTCTWKCEFFTACPMFDDGSSVEAYLAQNFEEGDPYARYTEETPGE